MIENKNLRIFSFINDKLNSDSKFQKLIKRQRIAYSNNKKSKNLIIC